MIVLFIVLVVAGIVVLNTMMMVVYERTREIGVLKALGMKPLRVVQLIATEAFCLTTVSVAAGVSIGGAMCWYMIQYGVKFMDGEFTFSGVRFAGKIIGHLPMEQVLHTVIAAYVVALFASLWPSVRAAKMLPVKAMREV
jgi:ABC-type antimicrobial peptide transport system permease subunit